MKEIKPRSLRKVCFLSLVLMLVFFAVPVLAEYEGVVKGSIVNIREGPGLSYTVTTQVKAGQALTVFDEKNNWLKVRVHTGKEGWIKGDFVEKNSFNAGSGGYVLINTEVLNVRKGPSTGYALVTKIGLNERHEVLEVKNGWYKIKVKNMEGWVSGEYVKFFPNTSKPEENKVPDENKQSQGNQQSPGQLPAAVLVTGNTVNIRQWNSMEAPVIEQVKSGDALTVLSSQGDWYQVQLLNGQKGWIANWLTKPLEGTIPSRDSIPKKEVLIVPIAEGKAFTVVDHGGKPELVLEGWTKGQYKIKQENDKKTLLLELQGPSTRRYEGKIERLGISKVKIYPQYDQAIVELDFNFSLELKPVSTDNDKVTTILFGVTQTQTKGLNGKVIVLDPGHASVQPGGGLDPGAIGLNLKLQEKDVNLAITLKVKKLLEEAGATVVLTHNGRTELTLAQRAGIANNLRADIFVSIHANSGKPGIAGHSTYYYAPMWDSVLGAQRYERQKLATLVQRELVKNGGRRDIGIIEDNFAVLRETRIPSILVETAYLSDKEEEILLAQDWYRQKLAEGIANGIKAYFD